LHIVDVNPAESAHTVNYINIGKHIHDIVVSGQYAYLYSYTLYCCDEVGDICLQIIDISSPDKPYIANNVGLDSWSRGKLAVSTEYAFMAGGEALEIIDITSPTAARLVQRVKTPGWAYSVAVSDACAVVVDKLSSLQAISYAPIENARIIGSISSFITSEACESNIAVFDSFVFNLDYWRGFQIIDIDPPDHARVLSTTYTFSNPRSMAASRDHVYVIDGNRISKFHIIDIGDPFAPRILKTIEMPERVGGIYFLDGSTCITRRVEGFYAINIDTPESAAIIGSISTPFRVGKTAIDNGYAYVRRDDDSITIIDISPLDSANIVDTYKASRDIRDFTISDGFLYAVMSKSTSYAGKDIWIINIEYPQSPWLVSCMEMPDDVEFIRASSDYVYAVNWHGRIMAVNVESPSSPFVAEVIQIESSVYNLIISGNYAYTGGSAGLRITKLWQ
jgi:hypothetical protein